MKQQQWASLFIIDPIAIVCVSLVLILALGQSLLLIPLLLILALEELVLLTGDIVGNLVGALLGLILGDIVGNLVCALLGLLLGDPTELPSQSGPNHSTHQQTLHDSY